MIVRTYGRKARCVGRSLSDTSILDASGSSGADESDYREVSLSQGGFQDCRHGLAAAFSSQDSSPWSLDPDLLPSSIPEAEDPFAVSLLPDWEEEEERGIGKKGRNLKRGSSGELKCSKPSATASSTSTLMEAQEFGEMMEHVDEVNFALDGLRPGQPARIRRASLLSLLNICSTAQRRRLLRARGMARRIIDAILGLNLDDSPCALAAATVFYVLASDVEDDLCLDSPSCVRFLVKLLDPPKIAIAEKKSSNINFTLLGKSRPQLLNNAVKGADSSSSAIISKVHEILVSCKEIKPPRVDDNVTKRPELSSKWIALLTMEKACLSTVSFEDTPDVARRVGGNFKEKLREFQALDAIFGIIADCHSTLEEWFKVKSHLGSEFEEGDGNALESVVLLLKCLKIMENAIFLSKDNQDYLLNMKAKLDSEGLTSSFVGVVLKIIKFLSGVLLLQSTSSISMNGKSNCSFKDEQDVPSTAFCGIADSPTESSKLCHKDQNSSTSNLGVSDVHSACSGVLKPAGDRADCSASTSQKTFHFSNGKSFKNTIGLKLKVNTNDMKVNSSRTSSGWISIRSLGSKVSSLVESRSQLSEDVKDKHNCVLSDPFAFDEDHLEPSKWELLSSHSEVTGTRKQSSPKKEHANGSKVPVVVIDDESSQPNSEVNFQFSDNSCPPKGGEDSNLLEDCLLSSVKVLMNLANDNPLGCQQIGACGGVDTMASLIACHFPSFDFLPAINEMEERTTASDKNSKSSHKIDRQLRDQELDFLVAILGLLVNLVEKDSLNRLRLASACVSVDQLGRSGRKGTYRDVIPLLCSIFMSNQGAGSSTVEDGILLCDDEETLLQGQLEAEMMIIEAYSALLLAFLSTESSSVREAIARCLPNRTLQILVPVLERFVAFHLTLNMIPPETHSAVVKVIESCKEP
ncbi:hypothetical protein AXF42_Ash008470 [Apostasia shenzhenica]|uniref:Wings apart-like protein C-terminal domain-containing protein n=1 Tax=Apostasia shenzhenica TaxID=1088818 RepID=A0A2I0AXZ2_9ASPA|nr:hypothetical protein AXF42_Ash008470 [Apostasia shenzhenica]